MKSKIFKTKNISMTLLTVIIALAIVSCNKQELTPTAPDDNVTAQEKKCGHNDPCLLTHIDQNLWGYTLDVTYNSDGNPDSLNIDGNFSATMEYDNKGRLHKANFAVTNGFYEFFYIGNSFQPYYMNWNNYGGLQAIDSFYYNNKGAVIKIRTNTTFLYGFGSVTETFDYNSHGNVTKASYASYDNSGALVSSYVENEATTFDNKKSFLAANQWLKYILYNNGEVAGLDYFRLFCKNNPINYTWGYDGGYNPITANYNYNNKGSVDTVNFHIFDVDGVTELGAFDEAATYTCNNSGGHGHGNHRPANGLANLPQFQKRLTGSQRFSTTR